MVDKDSILGFVIFLLIAMAVAAGLFAFTMFDLGRFLKFSVFGDGLERTRVAIEKPEPVQGPRPTASPTPRPARLSPPPGTLDYPVVSLPNKPRSVFEQPIEEST